MTEPFASVPDLDARSTDKELALDGASAAVRAWAGWHIWPPKTEAVTVDGSGGPVQMLPTLRLTAVSSVVNDGATVTDFQWSEVGFLRLPAGRFTSKLRGVVATITHGFTDVPVELVQVVIDAAVVGMATSGSAVQSESAGPFSVSYRAAESALSSAAMSSVARYRLPPGA